MPRLFTALEIPVELAEELALFRGGIAGGRWIDPEFYHITLRFIGDVDRAVARDVVSTLAQIRRSSLNVTLTGLDYFGGERPRAIVAKVQPSQPLLELQAEQERLLRRIGFEPEPRKFTPHVTLARLRQASQISVADYLSARGFLSRSFTATRFVLLSSRDSVGGGPYQLEASYPLL
eukprot:gene10126-10193_t